ncbi:tannase precursor [Fusarium albosuccineum]|uniref:Carboxylic ester hydrolase n=1 Tax=Fusarium albosuccineum TaxID=1237068 RepID=A0A8H4L4P4_9HYPO|nr:tannase precursor [Fusarium albosuccineum]
MWFPSNFSALSALMLNSFPTILAAPECTSRVFDSITLENGQILSVQTNLSNVNVPPFPTNVWPTNSTKQVNVCQVTVQYTHPGWNDTINTYIWLPSSGWNKRFVGVGGGGWSTGDIDDLGQPVSQGFAAVTTDGGHLLANRQDLAWAVASEGNLNWYALHNFASVALDDAATLGKAVTKAYYGQEPKYSYWTGCSTGGRQGHMLAQRYPTQYNGILATASAFNWDRFIVSEYWPQLSMGLLDYYPSPCELDAITKAAIDACDTLDGVKDGVISNPNSCHFDPNTVVGSSVDCKNPTGTIKISEKAAKIASATWFGPRTEDGKFLWHGLGHAASLAGLANTNCTSVSDCTSSPFPIAAGWLQTFVLQNSSANLQGMTHSEYSRLFRQSVNRFASVIGTADADLTDFKNAGGKLISWHGTADQLIPFNGSVDYYERVLAGDPKATDYYRFFEAPGVEHCSGGKGWYPGSAFDALVKWVEGGVAPETLYAKSIDTDGSAAKTRDARLCLYPKQLTYVDGDPSLASSFTCK